MEGAAFRGAVKSNSQDYLNTKIPNPGKKLPVYERDLAIVIIPNVYRQSPPLGGVNLISKTQLIPPKTSKKPKKTKDKLNQMEKQSKEPPRPPPPQQFRIHPEWERLKILERNSGIIRATAKKKFLRRRTKILSKPSLLRQITNRLLLKKVHYLSPFNVQYNLLETEENNRPYSWNQSLSITSTTQFEWQNRMDFSERHEDRDRWEWDDYISWDETLPMEHKSLSKYKIISADLSRKPFKKLHPMSVKYKSNRTMTRKLLVKPLHRVTRYTPGSNHRLGKMKGIKAGWQKTSRPLTKPITTKNTKLNLYHVDERRFNAEYGHSDFISPYVVFVHSPVNAKKIRKIFAKGD